MIKLCGIILVMLCCVGVSIKRMNTYKCRSKELTQVKKLLDFFESQIRYCAEPTSEIILDFVRINREDDCPVISCCADMVSNGHPFPAAMRECCDHCESSLTGEEINALAEFSGTIGRSDAESDIKCCKYYGELFLNQLNEAREQESSKGRMAIRLGLLAEAAAFILFI